MNLTDKPEADYFFEKLSEDRLSDYATVFEKVFHYRPSIDEIRQKFSCEAENLKYLGFLAYHSTTKEPAAYYGIFPVFYKTQGRTQLYAQSGSTMTAPEHRGRGLFKILAHETYKYAAKQGIGLVFGMPNKFSHQGLISLKWKFPYKMNAYRFPLPTLQLFMSLIHPKLKTYFQGATDQDLKPPQLSFFNHEAVTEPDFAEAVQKTHDKRTAHFYFNKPGVVAERGGIRIWYKTDADRNIAIGDIFIPTETSASAVYMTFLLFYAAAILKSCASIKFYCSPQHVINRYPLTRIFSRPNLWFGYFNLDDSKKSADFIRDTAFSYGDYDTF